MGKKRKQRSRSESRTRRDEDSHKRDEERSKSQSAYERWNIKESETSQPQKKKKVASEKDSPKVESRPSSGRRLRDKGGDKSDTSDTTKVDREDNTPSRSKVKERKVRRNSPGEKEDRGSSTAAENENSRSSPKKHHKEDSHKTEDKWVEKQPVRDEDIAPGLHISKRIFENHENGKALVILRHPEKYIIRGKAVVSCLIGEIRIFGFQLTPNKGPKPVYSPESNSYITIETVAAGNMGQELDNVIPKFFSDEKTDIRTALHSTEDPVVLIIEELKPKLFTFLTTITPYKELFYPKNVKQGQEPACCVFEGRGINLYSQKVNMRRIRIPKDYDKVEEWMSNKLRKGEKPVIVVCGGKDSGKSTLTRYLVNRALNIVPALAYMDCDLGQTEFTGPGCVSITRVEEPLLGPPFTHQRTSHRSCFVGQLSPADVVEDYMKCLENVHSKYGELKNTCPLIVNTMGWNKGLGLILLARTLRIVKPDLVVQLDCAKDYKNMPRVTSQFIQENHKLIPDVTNENQESMKESHKLISVNSVVDQESEIQDTRYRAPDHRTLSLLANFGPAFEILDTSESFNALVPYELPWQQVAVHVAHQTVPRSQIMYALNASFVGLCVVSSDKIVDSGIEGYPKFLSGSAIYECLGFGFIRAIDPRKKIFYILTSLSESECVRVNCLVRGAVDVPQQILMNQAYHQDTPYIGNPKDVTGATCVNRRRHMLRKSGGGGDAC